MFPLGHYIEPTTTTSTCRSSKSCQILISWFISFLCVVNIGAIIGGVIGVIVLCCIIASIAVPFCIYYCLRFGRKIGAAKVQKKKIVNDMEAKPSSHKSVTISSAPDGETRGRSIPLEEYPTNDLTVSYPPLQQYQSPDPNYELLQAQEPAGEFLY